MNQLDPDFSLFVCTIILGEIHSVYLSVMYRWFALFLMYTYFILRVLFALNIFDFFKTMLTVGWIVGHWDATGAGRPRESLSRSSRWKPRVARIRWLWISMVEQWVYREYILGSQNLYVLYSKDSLDSRTIGSSLKEKKKVSRKGKCSFPSSSIICLTMGRKCRIWSMS